MNEYTKQISLLCLYVIGILIGILLTVFNGVVNGVVDSVIIVFVFFIIGVLYLTFKRETLR